MRSLDNNQRAMMQALDLGPDHLPDDLFAGPHERVLVGMKVHANTISHARLAALEETFPRTRDVIGHERFNQHSRLFLQQPGVTGQALSGIGAGFDHFLMAMGESPGVADLALFEWLWLQAFHAADAVPLELAALAGQDPDDLLALNLLRHPSALVKPFERQVHELIGENIPEVKDAAAILLTRPQDAVLVSAASMLMAQLLAAAGSATSIGNLLAFPCEPDPDGTPDTDANMQGLVALINAGAFVAA